MVTKVDILFVFFYFSFGILIDLYNNQTKLKTCSTHSSQFHSDPVFADGSIFRKYLRESGESLTYNLHIFNLNWAE